LQKKQDSLDYFLSQSSNLTPLAIKSNTFSVITQNNGHYAVQGHSRSPILVPIESSYAAYLHPSLHRFQVIADYRSNSLSTGGVLLLFNCLIHSFDLNPYKLMTMKFFLKKLEISLCRTV